MDPDIEITGATPLISIIIATLNSGHHIRECLTSVASQEYKHKEVIIVDGGSTDNTYDIVKEFDTLNICWHSGTDRGIYDALNKGAKMSNGQWLHFLGSDDRLLPGFSALAGKLKEENTIYYGNSEPYYIGPGKPPYTLLTGRFTKYRLAKYCINHQAILYPATVFGKYSYDLRYKVFSDYAMNIRLWGDAGFKKMHYPFVITSYNMNGFSSVNSDELFRKDKRLLIRENLGLPVYLRFLFKQKKKKWLGQKE